MNFKFGTMFLVFIWCIFMGITVGSIGIGAAFPSANLIAKPFVCPVGQMVNSSDYYQVSPVESVTTITWYCVNAQTGEKQELSMWPMSLWAGTIYGLLLFLVVFAFMWSHARRTQWQRDLGDGSKSDMQKAADDPELQELVRQEAAERAQSAPTSHKQRQGKESTDQRLEKLKSLRESGLITEQDYAKRKTEILEDI